VAAIARLMPMVSRPGLTAFALAALLFSPLFEAGAAVSPIDPSRTSVEFVVDGVGWPRTKGRFNSFSGRIAVDLQKPEASSVAFLVAAESIDVGSPAFDDYLRGDAFFDVAHFPEITFVSTRVEKLDDRHARVTGDLTLRGVTRPLAVDVEVDGAKGREKSRLRFRATAVVHRLEFGMNAGFPVISNDVDLVIATEAEAGGQ
jgi:polyisoprenoid-binding protein YceI